MCARVPASQHVARRDAVRYTRRMSASSPAAIEDPVIAAFENAPALDEPLSAEEEETIRKALASGDEGISTAELHQRLHPKA